MINNKAVDIAKVILSLVALLVVSLVSIHLLTNRSSEVTRSDVLAVTTVDELRLTNQIQQLTQNSDGSYTIRYFYTLRNTSSYLVYDIEVVNDLNRTFGASSYSIESLTSSGLAINSGFNGGGNKNILTGSDSLEPNESATITLVVHLDPGSNPGPYENYIEASGLINGPASSTSRASQQPSQGASAGASQVSTSVSSSSRPSTSRSSSRSTVSSSRPSTSRTTTSSRNSANTSSPSSSRISSSRSSQSSGVSSSRTSSVRPSTSRPSTSRSTVSTSRTTTSRTSTSRPSTSRTTTSRPSTSRTTSVPASATQTATATMSATSSANPEDAYTILNAFGSASVSFTLSLFPPVTTATSTSVTSIAKSTSAESSEETVAATSAETVVQTSSVEAAIEEAPIVEESGVPAVGELVYVADQLEDNTSSEMIEEIISTFTNVPLPILNTVFANIANLIIPQQQQVVTTSSVNPEPEVLGADSNSSSTSSRSLVDTNGDNPMTPFFIGGTAIAGLLVMNTWSIKRRLGKHKR